EHRSAPRLETAAMSCYQLALRLIGHTSPTDNYPSFPLRLSLADWAEGQLPSCPAPSIRRESEAPAEPKGKEPRPEPCPPGHGSVRVWGAAGQSLVAAVLADHPGSGPRRQKAAVHPQAIR